MNKAFFILASTLCSLMAVVGIVGSALYWQYKSKIDNYTQNCLTPYLPILNIDVLTNNASMFTLTSTLSGTFGVETFGNGILSNDSYIIMNEGYIPHINPVSGYVGWEVPHSGVYEISTFITGFCSFYINGNVSAPNGTCGISNVSFTDASFTFIPFYTTNFSTTFNDILSLQSLNAFIGTDDNFNSVFGDPPFGPATPDMRVHAKTNSFTSLVQINNTKSEFIIGGVFTFNANYAIKILHRYFSIQRIK